jgi:hypothetical protein
MKYETKDLTPEERRKTIREYREENEILKQLLKNGFFYVNYSSTDCDGCTAVNFWKFKSIEEYHETLNNTMEWVEGSFYYNIVELYPDGTPINLNKESSGGQWSAY